MSKGQFLIFDIILHSRLIEENKRGTYVFRFNLCFSCAQYIVNCPFNYYKPHCALHPLHITTTCLRFMATYQGVIISLYTDASRYGARSAVCIPVGTVHVVLYVYQLVRCTYCCTYTSWYGAHSAVRIRKTKHRTANYVHNTKLTAIG